MTGYYRCECHTGDVGHPGPAVHLRVKGHAFPSKRCTRRATVELRRTVTTDGTPIPIERATWYRYCEPCAAAIETHQGLEVERRGK